MFNSSSKTTCLDGERTAQIAQITNLLAAPDGRRFAMLAEILWCHIADEQGQIVAGGRFLKALAKMNASALPCQSTWSSDEPIAGSTQAAAW